MTIKSHKQILMTGAAGNLGREMRTRLSANCTTLRLSDRLPFGDAQPGEEVVLADLADANAVSSLVQGVDAIVHFGGVSVEGPSTCMRLRAPMAYGVSCLPVPTM